MDFNALAYPEFVCIDGNEYEASRDISKGRVLVPYTETPDVGIGDLITQKSGKREIHLKVLDTQFLEGCTGLIGTKHPHLLTLSVENTISEQHKTSTSNNTTFNIGSISSEQLQVGNNNTLSVNITVQRLVEEIAKSNDPEAKSLLKNFLDNSTVGSIIGAGSSALISMLAANG